MILYLSFRNLFRNARRTIAVLLTVALGAGALFSFKGFINGILDDYRENTVHAHYGHGQINTKGYRETVYEKPWKYWIKDFKNINGYLAKKDGVEHIFPRITFSGLLKKGSLSISGQGEGIVAQDEAEFFHCLNIDDGNPLKNEKNGIVLGKGLASALKAKPGDFLTIYVNTAKGDINNAKFKVIGIFYTGSQDFDNRMFRIQLPAAQSLMKTTAIESISIGLKDHKDWERFAKDLKSQFTHLDATSFDVLDKIYYQHSVDWLNTQFAVVQTIIIGIVLLGIFNTISSAILERKQEIGNLRANGESVFDVMKLIVTEGALMALFGSLIGIGLSYFILMGFLHHGIKLPPGPGLTNEMFISFKFSFKMFFKVFSLNFFVVVFAATLAGIKVAKMPIAKALRSY
jgi:putative ABC transport system permease protein